MERGGRPECYSIVYLDLADTDILLLKIGNVVSAHEKVRRYDIFLKTENINNW
jgi:hypothetical protein